MEAHVQTMAKRVRGSTSRPGQRRPLQRSTARSATKPVAPTTGVVARPPDELTDAEAARAAELEAAIIAQEREADEAKRRARAARTTETVVPRAGSSLAVSAAEEYAYVARDVRRIAIVGGGLIAILLGLWAVAQVTGFSVI
jgi:hypothetical protein